MSENNEIEYTGERMIPGKACEESEFEHIARYQFALPYVEGRRTLDAGCGDGYGTAILAVAASEALGVDISPEAVQSAIQTYQKPNLSYKIVDLADIPFERESFDAVVCFEVFEHLEEPDKLLAGIRTVMSHGGVLVISTPNASYIKSSEPNPFHVKEYTFDEFTTALTRFFPEQEFSYEKYGQFNLRRRTGAAAKALQGWIKLKRKLGIGKILPDKISGKVKDSSTEPYSIDDFAFSGDDIENAEYFVYVIHGKT